VKTESIQLRTSSVGKDVQIKEETKMPSKGKSTRKARMKTNDVNNENSTKKDWFCIYVIKNNGF
jgi:hypothetical protein